MQPFTFQCKVKPNSKINTIILEEGPIISIKLKAPAQDGKANEALIKFLSEIFDVPKSNIRIATGHTSRIKRLNIEGFNEKEFNEIIQKHKN